MAIVGQSGREIIEKFMFFLLKYGLVDAVQPEIVFELKLLKLEYFLDVGPYFGAYVV